MRLAPVQVLQAAAKSSIGLLKNTSMKGKWEGKPRVQRAIRPWCWSMSMGEKGEQAGRAGQDLEQGSRDASKKLMGHPIKGVSCLPGMGLPWDLDALNHCLGAVRGA